MPDCHTRESRFRGNLDDVIIIPLVLVSLATNKFLRFILSILMRLFDYAFPLAMQIVWLPLFAARWQKSRQRRLQIGCRFCWHGASAGGSNAAYAEITSSLFNLVFRTRFFPSAFFLLFDEPQPRKANGGDHHDDENGVLGHRNRPGPTSSIMFGECEIVRPPLIRPLIHVKRFVRWRSFPTSSSISRALQQARRSMIIARPADRVASGRSRRQTLRRGQAPARITRAARYMVRRQAVPGRCFAPD